jgi:hypothetical protein
VGLLAGDSFFAPIAYQNQQACAWRNKALADPYILSESLVSLKLVLGYQIELQFVL